MIELLVMRIGDLHGMGITVLGLAFKNDTDGIREARSIPVIRKLLGRGASVAAYDPLAAENMRTVFPDVECFQSAADALSGAEGCLIMTEIVVTDGRRAVSVDHRVYEGICW